MISTKSRLKTVFMAILIVGGWYLAWRELPGSVARLSFLITIKLAFEVTAICLFVGAPATYAAFRQPRWSRLPSLLIGVSGGSLLVPTIARSLSFCALFSYYGPLATGLRDLGLWPQGQPLDSSHTAVVIALVTLYLPFAIIILSESMQSLGRLPDLASIFGANGLQTAIRVTLPRLFRPIAIGGLVIFSQTLGVIITPRILGSEDVTLAILIDDLLKRTMDTQAALRVAIGEMAVAVPIAAIAAYYIEKEMTARSRPIQPALRFRGGVTLALLPIGALIVVPLTLLALSLERSPVLDITSVFRSGPTLQWYWRALMDVGFRSVALTSLWVWITAAVLSIIPAALASVLVLPHPQVRRFFRCMALILLFVPQNALGILLFMALSGLPAGQFFMPGWFLAGIGQAVPGVAFSFLLMDRGADRLEIGR